MKQKRSFSISLRRFFSRISDAFDIIARDRISVYAAQATLFIVISSIPFVMLLFSLSQFIIPDRIYDFLISFGNSLPGSAKSLYMNIIEEMYARPAMNLISITAVTTFWTASRGIAAVRGGIATVYKAYKHKGFFRGIIISLIYTAVFVALIIALVLVLLFGEQLFNILSGKFALIARFSGVFRYRIVIFFIFLTLFFDLLYYAVGKRAHLFTGKFFEHLPGAVISSAAWVLFSYFYSLYTLIFSGASYIYGSLAAIVLLMLWLYFCMMILLFGAEVNKILAMRRRSTMRSKLRSDSLID
ncbi:MAG: YihY/virulence factor BrkB family protein [Clostridia bacterium]|nr:YihY/virulence factor BrkB family protein [Clostridia bacterium]